MLTLDEAIAHCKEKAAELREYSDVLSETSTTPKGKEISDCLECAEEHEQLAEWLTELKKLRETMEMIKKRYILVEKGVRDNPYDLMIGRAPTVEPQDRWGKWVVSEIRCPNCLEYFDTGCYSKGELNKCPSCGAKMKGGAE